MPTERAKLLELAERCEAAQGPDRGLDMLICTALNTGRRTDPRDPGPDRFTASIDAAMTLVPKHLMEWEVCAYDAARDPRFGRFQSRIKLLNYADDPDELGPQAIANAATPALALAAASLRARATENTDAPDT